MRPTEYGINNKNLKLGQGIAASIVVSAQANHNAIRSPWETNLESQAKTEASHTHRTNQQSCKGLTIERELTARLLCKLLTPDSS